MRLLITLVSSLLFAASATAQNRFVYLNNQSEPNAVSAFQINADGSLSPVSGASGTGVFAPDGESISVISYPPPTCK